MKATVTMSGKEIRVGCDFIEAVTGNPKSHGWIQIGPVGSHSPIQYSWVSTMSISDTESTLRLCARNEGVHVHGFMSQAI